MTDTDEFLNLQARVKEIMVLEVTGALIGDKIRGLANSMKSGSENQRLRDAIAKTRMEAMSFVAHIINVE